LVEEAHSSDGSIYFLDLLEFVRLVLAQVGLGQLDLDGVTSIGQDQQVLQTEVDADDVLGQAFEGEIRYFKLPRLGPELVVPQVDVSILETDGDP
jgi:hypothetical protein